MTAGAFLLLIWSEVWAVPAFSQNALPASRLELHAIQLTGEGQNKRVSIQFSHPPSGIKSFSLASPPRIVIDVQGPTRGLALASYPAQDEIIKQVRVGYHAQSIRFVLDLRVETIPTFSAKQDAAVVNVVLGRQGKISEQAAVQVLFSHTGKRTIQRTVIAQKTASGAQARPKTAATPGVLLPEIAPPPDARKVEMRPARTPAPAQLATTPQAARPKPSQAATLLDFSGTYFPPEKKPSASSSASPKVSPNTLSPLLQPPVEATPSPWPEKPRLSKSLSREARRHLGKGQTLYDKGSVDEAIVEWQQTARLAPNNAKVHHLLGLALQDRGDHNEAITELNTSLQLDPKNATAYVHLAQALEAQGDVQGARTAYTKALKLVPTSAHVHNRLGHLLASQNDWRGAAKEWRQTTKLQPDYAYAYANLGEALERIEKKKEALEAYRQAVSLDPSAPFVAEVNQRITRLNAYDS